MVASKDMQTDVSLSDVLDPTPDRRPQDPGLLNPAPVGAIPSAWLG